ncbi:MAG TPA: OsmC family protein [bacterium]
MNGYDVPALGAHIEGVKRDLAKAERNPVVTAHWVGKSEARIEGEGFTMHTGGDGQPSAMKALLGTLAGCDIEVIALHATLLGITLESLTIEARGHFTVQRLYGLAEGPAPGYDRISYTIKVKAPGATTEQLNHLREMVERASPVGDSLSRPIPLTLEFGPGL